MEALGGFYSIFLSFLRFIVVVVFGHEDIKKIH